jgi:predicted GNAT superfamily acetyltransferase
MTLQQDLIRRADAADIDDILALQSRNSPANGGALAVAFSPEWLAAAVAAMPVMVARRERRLVGYALSSTFASQAHVPMIQAMLRSYAIPPGAFLYGPVCVAQCARGRGIAGRLFAALCAQLPGRPAVTFIRSDNILSRRAHAKMGLCEAAEFTHAGATFLVMAYGPGEHAIGDTEAPTKRGIAILDT